ncbi:IS3 family transposase, partial [Acerihabitans sp.]|uniref:IS3 family transposase n=1 Tax=Acerihabitans sp. TaxID=2811394 RepID=UPI002EDAFA36
MKELCAAFGVSRSSYYYQRLHYGRINSARLRLKKQVIALHSQSRGAAGARSLSALLRGQGEFVGRYKVIRLMREAGISSKQPRRHRYETHYVESTIASNHLKRQFTVNGPNEVWCGDVTYIWAGKSWLYLAVVMDLYARKVVGWAFSANPNSQLTKQALEIAYFS